MSPKDRPSLASSPALPKRVVVLLLALATGGGAGSSVLTSLDVGKYRDDAVEKKLTTIEEKTQKDHDALIEMGNDIKWIRKALEK
jgi:hypothetical protein